MRAAEGENQGSNIRNERGISVTKNLLSSDRWEDARHPCKAGRPSPAQWSRRYDRYNQ